MPKPSKLLKYGNKAKSLKKQHPMVGNKNAVGSPGPSSPYDLDALAQALEEWSKRDDAMHFAEFTLEYNEYPQRMYDWKAKSPVFSAAFKRARSRIAIRIRKRLHDKENPYNYGLFMRELGFYDEMIDSYEERKEEKK